MPESIAIAIGAHPDDIEFYMAGTLVLLRRAGWQTHYLNVGNGCCGSVQYDARHTRVVRRTEAKCAAKTLGAHFHESLCNDLEIFYESKLLRRLAAVIREVKPNVVLTHAPVDYMEDHTNTSRLVVTAAFAHAMPNFRSAPPRSVAEYDVTVYHAMPHGLRDPLRRLVKPGAFVNTASVQGIKRAALAAPPTGPAANNVAKRPCPLARTFAPVPSGESPDGTGGSPVLPTNHSSNTL